MKLLSLLFLFCAAAFAETHALKLGMSGPEAARTLGLPQGAPLVAHTESGEIRAHLKKGQVAAIEQRFKDPREIDAELSPGTPALELPPREGKDYTLPERRIAVPEQGKTWTINAQGKVTRVLSQAPWKSNEPLRSVKEILSSPPPGLKKQLKQKHQRRESR